MKFSITFISILVAGFNVGARADSPATAPATQPGDVQLSLAPATLPEPALKYLLTPSVADQTPGDAVPLYLQGFMRLNISRDSMKIGEMLDAPRAAFSADAAEGIDPHSSNLMVVEPAARRDRCHWESALRELGYNAYLPYLNTSRSAAQLLALRSRIELARGHFEQALHTLQTGFALAEHLKQDALLVQGMVAVGVENLMLDRVQELIQTPGTPNLYWALANLPRPVGDIRAMARISRSFLELEAPEFKRGGSGRISSARLATIVAHLWENADINSPDIAMQKRKAIEFVAGSRNRALDWLAAHGHAPARLREIPDDEIVSLYFIELYRLKSDELFARAGLPVWEALPAYQKVAADLPRARADDPLLEFQPSLGHTHRWFALTERRVCMLQIAEALRGYAAAHAGKLPASLDELVDTPAPRDPMNGKPFMYEISGNSVVLRSLDPAERVGELSGVYRITVK